MTIIIDDARTWPEIGSVWEHRNGIRYSVEDFANIITHFPQYPTTIIYRNVHTRAIYTRPLNDWDRSFTLVSL